MTSTQSQSNGGDDQTTGQTQSFDDSDTQPTTQTGYTQPGGEDRSDRSLDGDSPYPDGYNRATAPTDESRAEKRQRRADAAKNNPQTAPAGADQQPEQ